MVARITAFGWRAYGSGEIAALHKVISLKRLGLSLARIAELMSDKSVGLDSVLALQEQALVREADRTNHALALIHAARKKLANGEGLSIDDLATLTTETTMSTKVTKHDWHEVFGPLIEKHFSPEKLAATTKRYFDQAKVTEQWNRLIADANKVMAKSDPASPEAGDIAQRWSALVEQFTRGDAEMAESARKVWTDAMADPRNAGKFPVSPELFAFIGKAMRALKAKNAA